MGDEIKSLTIQNIAKELVEKVKEPRTTNGHAFRYSVYQKWAGERIVRFIFEQTEYLDVVCLDDVYKAVEIFRDRCAVYQSYNETAQEIFSAAGRFADDYLDVLDNMKPRKE